MDIPGLKQIRLLAQQPVALLPGRGVDISSERMYFLEVTFESGGVMNIPISRVIHETWIEKLKESGRSIEQRVTARGSVALPAILGVATQETYLALDRPLTPGEVEGALREAAGMGVEAPVTTRTVPATPLALEAAGCGKKDDKP